MPGAFTSVRVGTAGWSIPRIASDRFGAEGPLLVRYAGQFDAVEINSSFYRPHRGSTYERWAACVPASFRFAVKAPRQITHERRLVGAGELLASFRDGIEHLGEKLGPVLFQLPPSLVFDDRAAGRFFGAWRGLCDALTVCEPRHPSWFSEIAASRLAETGVTRVIADPPTNLPSEIADDAAACAYYRLHGSPIIYETSYDDDQLGRLARRLSESGACRPTWCIFDNTKFGAAITNALALNEMIAAGA